MLKTREETSIIGHLADDCKLKNIDSKRQVLTCSVVLNSFYRNKNKEKVEEKKFYNVEMWFPGGKNLESITKLLKKGAQVAFSGQIKRLNPYLDKNGNAACQLVLNADVFDVLTFAKSTQIDGTEISHSTEEIRESVNPDLEGEEEQYPFTDPLLES